MRSKPEYSLFLVVTVFFLSVLRQVDIENIGLSAHQDCTRQTFFRGIDRTVSKLLRR